MAIAASGSASGDPFSRVIPAVRGCYERQCRGKAGFAGFVSLGIPTRLDEGPARGCAVAGTGTWIQPCYCKWYCRFSGIAAGFVLYPRVRGRPYWEPCRTRAAHPSRDTRALLYDYDFYIGFQCNLFLCPCHPDPIARYVALWII